MSRKNCWSFVLAAVAATCVAAGAAGAVRSEAGHAPPASSRAQEIPLRLPPELIFNKTVGPEGAVVFRHETHVEFSGRNCVACHPQTFKILRTTRATSHEDMDAGRSCGVCHDGRKAFATKDQESCASCHAGWGASR